MKTVSILIAGRVQGVGFRYFIKEKAEKLGIKGFVKNMPDGMVYIEAQADETILNEFIKFCRTGPYYAIVKQTLINDIPYKNFSCFEIIRDFDY
jgi:acylphosphatase